MFGCGRAQLVELLLHGTGDLAALARAADAWVAFLEKFVDLLPAQDARADALATVCRRVFQSLAPSSRRLDDAKAVQLALVCAMRKPDHLLARLFARPVCDVLDATTRSRVALRADEWTSLFISQPSSSRETETDATIARAIAKDDVADTLLQLAATSLRRTVNEPAQRDAWSQPWKRLLCYVALHLHDSDAALVATLGSIVGADRRSLDVQRETIDKSDQSIGAATVSLADAVTTVVAKALNRPSSCA